MSKLTDINKYIYPWLVWVLRIAIGATFIYAGFAKAVDPWGFTIKIEEYLAVWNVGWIGHEAVLCGAILISGTEFSLGVLLVLGCLRSATVWCMLLFMAVMLPLTAYIALYSPVDDCGCFGEALVISNNATFYKNIALTLGLVYLLFTNTKVTYLVRPWAQWIIVLTCILYCLIISITGYHIQPLVDYRQYKIGTSLLSDIDDDITFIYEKDGIKEEFPADALPDSTWRFVERKEKTPSTKSSDFSLFDGDDNITDEAVLEKGPQLILTVPDPDNHGKERLAMANILNHYIAKFGGNLIAAVSMPADSVDLWKEKVGATYEVYTADDTVLKELVRGKAGLVYLRDGEIMWKRSLESLPGDFPDMKKPGNVLDDVYVIDNGVPIKQITWLFVSVIVVIGMASHINTSLRRKKKVNMAKILSKTLKKEFSKEKNGKKDKKN